MLARVRSHARLSFFFFFEGKSQERSNAYRGISRIISRIMCLFSRSLTGTASLLGLGRGVGGTE